MDHFPHNKKCLFFKFYKGVIHRQLLLNLQVHWLSPLWWRPPKKQWPLTVKTQNQICTFNRFPSMPNGSTESFRKQKSINAKHELIFSTPRKGAPSPSTPHSKVTPRKMWWFPWWPGPAKLHCLFGQRAAWKKNWSNNTPLVAGDLAVNRKRCDHHHNLRLNRRPLGYYLGSRGFNAFFAGG